jgi:hypothetical protein
MTRVRHLAVLALVCVGGWLSAPACGGQKALDVTAPDESSSGSGDWADEPIDEGDTGEGKESKGSDFEAYDPCMQKKCGTPCAVCHPSNETCDEVQLLKQCNLQGECVIAPVDCTAPEEESEEKAK